MSASTEADVDLQKTGALQPVTISYCTSWSYRGAAQQVSGAFHQRFGADLPVVFETYPPSPTQAAVARLVTLIQYSIIVFALAGQQICDAVGMTSRFPPDFWVGLAEKRFSLIIGCFFFGNTIINSIVSTGAFEVLYGSEVIFSKLSTGRMPTMDELLTTLQETITASAATTTR